MIWYAIAGIAAAAAVALLIFTFLRDRRYRRLKTSQAMSRELWKEIEEEREAALLRRDRFHKALDEARTQSSSTMPRR